MKFYSLPVVLFLVIVYACKSQPFLGKSNSGGIPAVIDQKTSDTLHQLPVIPGDLADPTILRAGKVFYVTGTSSEWAPHFPLFHSTDLIHWQQAGYIFPKTPAWASSSFWAPELFCYRNTYYLYYVARKRSDGMSCIGVATAADPLKGFTDHGILLEFGKEAIDPFVIEDNGKLYITFKAYGLENRPIEILGMQLSDDGLKAAGASFMLLRDDERKGLEGQCMIKRDKYYYLLYSTGDCCGRGCSYKVNVARAESIKGPYTKFESNPILTETMDWKCPGHGTITTTPKGLDYYLYHAYNKKDNVYTGRQGMLAQVRWDASSGWPSMQPINGVWQQGFKDDFNANKPGDEWQWDLRHTQPFVTTGKGNLSLSGQITADNKSGTALTTRPLSGNYEIYTAVVNNNASLKGLVLYGDAGQAAGIGVKADTIQVWQVKGKEKEIIKAVAIHTQQPVYLKIGVSEGYKLSFFWGDSENALQPIDIGSSFFDGEFLPPWDRSPRPGLLHDGDMSAPAVFSFFEIKYQ